MASEGPLPGWGRTCAKLYRRSYKETYCSGGEGGGGAGASAKKWPRKGPCPTGAEHAPFRTEGHTRKRTVPDRGEKHPKTEPHPTTTFLGFFNCLGVGTTGRAKLRDDVVSSAVQESNAPNRTGRKLVGTTFGTTPKLVEQSPQLIDATPKWSKPTNNCPNRASIWPQSQTWPQSQERRGRRKAKLRQIQPTDVVLKPIRCWSNGPNSGRSPPPDLAEPSQHWSCWRARRYRNGHGRA